MKLSILSGTFDPIHNAHISLAKYVKSTFNYDEILVIPAFNPPFKENSSSAKDRMKMVELALEDYKWLKISDIEFKREGKSYSVLTIKELYKKYNVDGKIGFVIGTDAYVNLNKWYQADELKKLVDFIVFERGFAFNDKEVQLRKSEGFNLIKAELPFEDISSSEIRKKVLEGENISNLVPKEVERYIKENELYK